MEDKEKSELSKETIITIKKARKRIKVGEFITEEEAEIILNQ